MKKKQIKKNRKEMGRKEKKRTKNKEKENLFSFPQLIFILACFNFNF